jgi:hypothetical protein
MGINNSASFDKAWSLLKEEITQAQIMQIQERNRQARQALENRNAMRERLIRYD